MEHDFIIITDTDEAAHLPPLQILYNNWFNQSLRTTTYYMTEQDYFDLVMWTGE